MSVELVQVPLNKITCRQIPGLREVLTLRVVDSHVIGPIRQCYCRTG